MGDQEKMEVEMTTLWRNMEKENEQGDNNGGDDTGRKPANTEKMEEMEKKKDTERGHSRNHTG